MPGVLDSSLDSGVSREVGKMAFFGEMDISLSPHDVAELGDFSSKILYSPSSSSSGRDSGDSEGELPDETTVDLVRFLDYENNEAHDSPPPELDDGTDLPKALVCNAACFKCRKLGRKDPRTNVSYRDPFMGFVNQNRLFSDGENATILGRIMSPLEEQQSNNPAPIAFNAWSHRKNTDDYHVFNKSSLSTLYQEEDGDEVFPDNAASSFSDHAATDDSDVDIETVTETPRTMAFLCAGSSRSSSPSSLSSSSLSPIPAQVPLQKGSLMTIKLGRSTSGQSSDSSASSSPKPKTLLRFNSQGVSSSASLAENLMLGRSHSISGHKRKLQKEKKLAIKPNSHPSCTTTISLSPASHQATCSHVLVSSNSVNFHDYAMSPGSCMSSTETARPTVMSKRMYKKRQIISLDSSDKEKQHHHNQLERNRRQKLADLFTDLRDQVPKTKTMSKASKVMILNDATQFICELRKMDKHQQREKDCLMQNQVLLKEQLKRLQSTYSLLY